MQRLGGFDIHNVQALSGATAHHRIGGVCLGNGPSHVLHRGLETARSKWLRLIETETGSRDTNLYCFQCRDTW